MSVDAMFITFIHSFAVWSKARSDGALGGLATLEWMRTHVSWQGPGALVVGGGIIDSLKHSNA